MQLSELYRTMGGDGESLYSYINKCANENSSTEAIKEYIPSLHAVADKALRPDKIIFVPQLDEDGRDTGIIGTDTAKVSRVPLSIQKYIISQKASFTKGNGIIIKPTNDKSKVYERVHSNWKERKIDYDLKEIIERRMSETRVAVIFYGEKGKESLDDFNFRYKIVSPLKGDTLYPFYDQDTGDLIAFGREYKVNKNTYYDFYVMNDVTKLAEIWKFENGKPVMISIDNDDVSDIQKQSHLVIKTPYTKLPIIYWEQPEGECHDTKDLISEFESEFSDFLTQMGYSADPILFAKGETMNLPAKGVRGKFVESNNEKAELKYVTPENATESRELEFKMFIKFIFALNRSILLDIETLKGLGAISGAALERFLIDVYMDASDKQQGEFGKGVQRMVNWLTSQWEILLDTKEKGFRNDVIFTKYSLQDQKERVELAVLANGGNPVTDIRGGVEMAGLVDDVEGVTKQIKAEQSVEQPLNNDVITN